MMHVPREDWALADAIILEGMGTSNPHNAKKNAKGIKVKIAVALLNMGPPISLFEWKATRAMSVKKEKKSNLI